MQDATKVINCLHRNIDNDYENETILDNENYPATSVVNITFLDTLKDMPDDAWDVSDEQNEFFVGFDQ